ncbi:chemotaxis protein CheW [Oceanospirillum sediminis]|uniref:Chemotaxis protein CheA n=1 Tax=Oceanospirillum sediminis TaxID=2760088 RepID=A0A839IPF7_9GAMM|nr:chemotaxis protein CheW [Oceanospirillum sediminis]MBB1486838.1 chemotaxis protein CheW [Oceanospirillum sediminis]
MSFDLSQFNQLFFEESAEHLATMESLMLNMDVQSPDMDDLNAVFRAAHSIKGNSGTFGFHDMTDVTHELETLLDLVRKGEAELTDEMVDVTLQAGDVLKGLLEAHQEGLEPDLEPSKAVIAELNVQLAKAKGETVVPSEPASDISDRATVDQESVGVPAESSQTDIIRSYLIHFPVTDDDTEMLFDSLKELGELNIIDSPENGGEEWFFSLNTDSAKSDIKELLEFLISPDGISIEEELNADDGSFGFFEDVSTTTDDQEEDPGYGFFDDLDKISSEAEDPGYGFFDEPEAPDSKESAEEKDESDDPGYGFFEDIEVSDSTEQLAESNSDTSGSDNDDVIGKALTGKNSEDTGQEFDGYGFFEPVDEKQAGGESFEKTTSKSTARAEVTAPVTTTTSSTAKQSAAKNTAQKVAKQPQETSIRVSVEKVDQLINQVGELVITQAMLTQMASEVDPILHEKMANGLAQLERNTRDLQDSVMSIRMMPISLVFSRFPRVVRDLAGKLNKKVKLEMVGENTELDRSMIEKLTDPLTHLIRNSLDHGIESPDKRATAGKDVTGTILLRASHQGGNIVVEVQDDGGGLNRERILSKAIEKGIVTSDSIPDSEVWQLIFAPGFSTAAEVTDVSGRGVGMDVVKKNITSLGGRLEIESMEGIGTRISIRLPLTLAILDGLQVALGDEIYIVPLTSIIGSMQPELSDIKTVSGEGAVIAIRDEYLPIIRLSDLMNMPGEFDDFEQGIMVILESDGQRVALFVDDLVGQSQVVIKSLEANYRKVDGVSGATILGTGRVALILDVAEIISMHKQRAKKHSQGMLV